MTFQSWRDPSVHTSNGVAPDASIGNRTGPDSEPYPKITIVTPSYNQGFFIEETLLSVLKQDYPRLEYFVRDGGSTDESPEIIARYASQLKGWVSEPDLGQSSAINAGFELGTGEIYGWLNSDDLYLPGALRAVASCFRSHPEAKVVVGRCVWVDENRRALRTKLAMNLSLSHLLNGGGGPGQPAVFFHRDVLKEVGLLNENLHLTMDWDYWLRIGLRFESDQIVTIDRDLAEARVWDGAKSPNAGLNRILEQKSVLDRLYADPSTAEAIGRFKNKAYSDIHWRRARWLFQHNQFMTGSISLLRASILSRDLQSLIRRLKKLRTTLSNRRARTRRKTG